MTADVINLRKARKARSRAEKERTAAENRVRFGRSKAERLAQAEASAHADAVLDGARRDVPATPDAQEQAGRDDEPA